MHLLRCLFAILQLFLPGHTNSFAAAGIAALLKGDVIINIHGLSMANIDEYMGRLGKLNPDNRANSEIVRSGKAQIMIVQL